MTPTTSSDIVVIGGGIIGLAAAWKTGSDGPEVVVVDSRPGRGATWAAAGMLAPVGEAHFGEEPLVRLNVAAASRWPGFAEELEAASGLPVAYRATGTVVAAMDASDRRWIDDVLAYQIDLGLDARRLTASGCRALEPLLSPGIRGGAEFRHDHQVDNRQVVAALVEACARNGVTMVADQAVSIDVAGGRVCGVSLAGGDRIRTGTVVLAAGSQSGQLAGVPDTCLPPVRPVKGLTLRLRMSPAGPSLVRTVRGLVHGRTSYLVPREDGSVVVGATMEERGFDTTVQAGAVYGLLSDARELVPALDEYGLEETTVGWRPGTPDNAPIVGWTSLDGLLVATGHFRNGILLAPETARAVAALVRGAEVDAVMAPFGPERFGPDRVDGSETDLP
jgi:glycine oxidase